MSEYELTIFAGEVRPTPGGCAIRYRHHGQIGEVSCREVLPAGAGVMFTIASDSQGEHARLVNSAAGPFGGLIYDNSDLQGSWWGPVRSERE